MKVVDPLCVKTEIGGKQRACSPPKKKCYKNLPYKKFIKELAPSPQQLLNEQGVQKISRLQNLKVRFRSWNQGSFCKRSKMERTKSLTFWCQDKKAVVVRK